MESRHDFHQIYMSLRPDLSRTSEYQLNYLILIYAVYNAVNDQTLHTAPEDDKLLQEDVSATPVKKEGLKGKERPKDIRMCWLVKTQYISPLSTDAARQVIIKARRDMRPLRGLLIPSNNIQLS